MSREEYVSKVSTKVLGTEVIYVIELANNVWFTGTFKESKGFDTHRTMVINCASIYTQEETAQIICENIIAAGKFKNAKVVSYCLKPSLYISQQEQRIKELEEYYEDKTFTKVANGWLKERNRLKSKLDRISEVYDKLSNAEIGSDLDRVRFELGNILKESE